MLVLFWFCLNRNVWQRTLCQLQNWQSLKITKSKNDMLIFCFSGRIKSTQVIYFQYNTNCLFYFRCVCSIYDCAMGVFRYSQLIVFTSKFLSFYFHISFYFSAWWNFKRLETEQSFGFIIKGTIWAWLKRSYQRKL